LGDNEDQELEIKIILEIKTDQERGKTRITCMVTPIKKKKSNLSRQMITWYHLYIATG
jgi:hypothetical protein